MPAEAATAAEVVRWRHAPLPRRAARARRPALRRLPARACAVAIGAAIAVSAALTRRSLRRVPPGSSAWQPRARTDPRPRSRRPANPGRGRRTARHRRTVAAGATVAVVVAALVPWFRATTCGGTSRGPASFAVLADVPVGLAAEGIDYEVPSDVTAHVPDNIELARLTRDPEWFGDDRYDHVHAWAFDADTVWRAASLFRLLDLASAHVNVVEGDRSSWTPPPCSCRRTTVWMYGGSTAWGLYQRDDHTIASALAKVAYDDGVVLDVRNKGQLGQLHWMEAERFAWDLTLDPPPDLVVFYDGVNEFWATNTLNNRGTGDIPTMVDPTTEDLWNTSGRAGAAPPGPPGSRLIGWPKGRVMDVAALARTTVERYETSRALSRATAERHGVTARYVWQPSRHDRPLVDEEPHWDAATENRSRLSRQLMRAALPADVIDLSESLADVDGPLFIDDVHHSERASRVVASKLYARLRRDLVAHRDESSR